MARRRTKKQKRRIRIATILFLFACLAAAAFQYRGALSYYWIVLTEKIEGGPYYSTFGPRSPRGYQVHGIDVSRYQGGIDWESVVQMKSGGDSISFVFIKATEGKLYRDPYFRRNWEESQRLKLIRGAYHYYSPSVNSNLQARNFISAVTLRKGDLPPVLDIEEVSPFGYDNLRSGLLNWLKIIEAHYGVKPIIYASASYYRDHLDRKEFKPYRIWVAHYRGGRPGIGSDRWTFWQYSDRGNVSGCKGPCDLNVFNGGRDELENLRRK